MTDGTCRRAFLAQLGIAALGAVLPVRELAALATGRQERRYLIPRADGAEIDRAGQVVLVRWRDMLYAFALACPHKGAALRWRADDNRFHCPKHKSIFQPDGELVEGKAKRGMDRYAIRRDGEAVVVDVAKVFEQSTAGAAWRAAYIQLSEK